MEEERREAADSWRPATTKVALVDRRIEGSGNGSERTTRKRPMRTEPIAEGRGRTFQKVQRKEQRTNEGVKPEHVQSKQAESSEESEQPVEQTERKSFFSKEKNKDVESRGRETEEQREEGEVRQNTENTRQKAKNETEENETGEIRESETKTNYTTIQVVIKGKKRTFKKRINQLKIFQFLRQDHELIEAVRMLTNKMAELVPKTEEKGKEIYEKYKNRDRENFELQVPKRNQERWGVISEWDSSIKELLEEIDPGQGNIKMERLKRRERMDGGFEWKKTRSILVRFEGDSLPTRLSIYDGKFGLKIHPYVRNVKQCNNCLRFGHIKKYCRAEHRLCFICGKKYHGQCAEEPKCVNCGGKHGSLARSCPTYQVEAMTNKIAAYKNKSYEECRNLAKIELGIKPDRRETEDENNSPDESEAYPRLPGTRRKIKIEKWENQQIPNMRNDWQSRRINKEEHATEEEISGSIERMGRLAERERRTEEKRIQQNKNEWKKKIEEQQERERKERREREREERKKREDEKLIEDLLALIKEKQLEGKLYERIKKETEKKGYREKQTGETKFEGTRTQTPKWEDNKGNTTEEIDPKPSSSGWKPSRVKPVIREIALLEGEEKIKIEGKREEETKKREEEAQPNKNVEKREEGTRATNISEKTQNSEKATPCKEDWGRREDRETKESEENMEQMETTEQQKEQQQEEEAAQMDELDDTLSFRSPETDSNDSYLEP